MIVHNAVSADSRIDYLKADIGKYYGLAAGMNADVVLTGSRTMCAAHPPDPDDMPVTMLPLPNPDDTRALLAVVDSRGSVRNWETVRQSGYFRDAIALCSRTTPPAYLAYLESHHIGAIITGGTHVDLRDAIRQLASRYHAKKIRVDAGGYAQRIASPRRTCR